MFLEIVALEVAHPIEPFAIESYFLFSVYCVLIRHSHIHEALYLVYDKIRLKFICYLFFSKAHQPIKQFISN